MKEYDDEIESEGEEELELLERKDYVELESDEAERERLEPKVSVESDLVNSVVVDPNFDDVTLPSLTFRVVLIGTALCILGASISQLFFFKSNAPSFSSFFIVLLSLPMGRFLAAVLPKKQIQIPFLSFNLNPGPFSKKEHLLIVVLAGSGSSAAYAGEIIAVQELYYHVDLGKIAGLLLLLSTQLVGFGLSGLTHKILVDSSQFIFPSTLVFVSLFETIHGAEGSAMLRRRMSFFIIAFGGIFIYQFLPGLFFPGLSSVATLCLLSPSPISSILSSGYNGFGFLNLSFDWTAIGANGPLFTPTPFLYCFYGGAILSMWFIVPLLYFSNFWDAQSFDSPLAAHLYNSTFHRFEILSVIKPDLTLDLEKFKAAAPLLLTPYFSLSYGISFAVLTSAISSVFLWNSKDIWTAITSKMESTDIHVKHLRDNYAPVPRSYYAIIFFGSLLSAIYLLIAYPTLQLSVLGLLLAILLAGVFVIPVGVIAAITNTTIGLNVISELIAGFLYPGKPIANVVFKTFSYMSLVQSIDLSTDLKLGLYMKIAPKHLFIAQIYGTALGSVVNYSLIRHVIDSKRSFLDGTVIDPSGQWSGRKPEIFFSASVIYGLIGPERFFAGPYRLLYWGFLVGAILPLIPWYLHKRRRRTDPNSSFWSYVSIPLILNGMSMAPEIPTNIILSGLLFSIAVDYVRQRRSVSFEQYGYILSAALDAGTSLNALAIYSLGLTFITWWGNSSIDSEHCIASS